jgi:hypothetical protein
LECKKMPWEITIRRSDGSPFGDFPTVRHQIITALPAVTFQRLPSGLERIAAARAAGVEFPEVIRQHFEGQPAAEQAEFEGDGFSLELYGFEAQPLSAIHANIRGNGNPVPVLAALCRPHDWLAIDDAGGKPIDLTGAEAAGWESFKAYRNRAISSIRAREKGA